MQSHEEPVSAKESEISKNEDQKTLEEMLSVSLKRTYELFNYNDGIGECMYLDEPFSIAKHSHMSSKISSEYKLVKDLPDNKKKEGGQKKKSRKRGRETQQTTTTNTTNTTTTDSTTINPTSSTQMILHTSNSSSDSHTEKTISMFNKRTNTEENKSLAVSLRRTNNKIRTAPKWHPQWKLMRVISGHLGWVRSIAVEPGNEWFATGSADRTIKIWHLASGKL